MFGWTYDYVVWEISWQNLQMMLIDMPYVDYNDKKTGKEEEEIIEVKSEADLPEYLKKFKKQK